QNRKQSETAFLCAATLLMFFHSTMAAQAEADASVSLEPSKDPISIVERDVALFQVSEKDFQVLDQFLKKNPTHSYAHFILGRCYERQGLTDLAAEQFEASYKLDRSPEDSLNRFRHHIESGELAEAYNLRVIVPSDSPSGKFMHALFLHETGVQNAAETIYNELLKEEDCPLGVATALGTVRMEKQNYTEAIALAEKDLAINKSYMGALLVKSESLLKLGRAAEVLSTLKQAHLEHPFNRRLNSLLYEADCQSGKWEDALRVSLLILSGSDAISFYENAKAQVRKTLKVLPKRRSKEIIAEMSKTIDPTIYGMKFHFFLSQVYFKMRRAYDALEQIEIAIAKDPAFEPSWVERARIKGTLIGDYKGAQKDFLYAHKLQRSDQGPREAYMRLSSRIQNEKRDIALQIKERIRKLKVQ
ncbi:MAG: tetratricopeptide repeat protein, partial [Candidatus Obscuribacterales bacterium]|nr:tetratricopeptide repeat protein [Candidatus Obscuribacterales bacterium]